MPPTDHERRHGGTSFFYKRRLTPGTYYIAVRLTRDVEDRAFWGSHGWYPVAVAVNPIGPVTVVVERGDPETPNEPETPSESGGPGTPDEFDEAEMNPRRAEKVATLMNLSPGQSYVHLYCALDRPDVQRVFSLRPDGRPGPGVVGGGRQSEDDLFVLAGEDRLGSRPGRFLVAAGLAAKEAQVRTTCEVFIETGTISNVSPDCRDLSVRAYTRFAGEMTPAANQHCMESPRDVFSPEPARLTNRVGCGTRDFAVRAAAWLTS